MSEAFSLPRFGKLFVKHTVDHYRSYLMSITVVAGVLILGGFFISYFAMVLLTPAAQSVLYFFLLALAGSIFTSTIFNDLGEKKKSIPSLLLPASTLEKFLVAWVYSYVVFILIFTLMYYLALMAVIYFHSISSQYEQTMVLFSPRTIFMYVLFSLLQSIALFGAIFFEKLHFIKTAFAFFITVGLLILINTLWAKALTGKNVAPEIPFSAIGFREDGQFYLVDITTEKARWVIWMVVIVTIFFWIAAYFRLKEKRV